MSINRGLQNTDIGKIAIISSVVQAIANYEFIGNLEAYIICIQSVNTTLCLIGWNQYKNY